MAGLWGFANCGYCSFSRGWLDRLEALGYPRHSPSIFEGGIWLIFFLNFAVKSCNDFGCFIYRIGLSNRTFLVTLMYLKEDLML